MDLKDAYFYIRIAPHTQTVFLNSCQLSGRSTAFQYSVPPSGLLRPHALSKCINAALPTQIERKAHPQLSGRLADFSSVPGYAYQPHRLSVYSLGVPKLWEPASREIAWGMRPCLSWDRVEMNPASREIEPRPIVFPATFRQGSSVQLRVLQRLRSSVRGNASFGTVAGTSEPVALKSPGAGSSLLSSKGFSATAGPAKCTDSHRQHVCGFIHKSFARARTRIACCSSLPADITLTSS